VVSGAPPVVAAIGTTHPYACTGLLVELTALAALGVRPVAVVAGVSAQDAERVLARSPVHPTAVAAQFAALAETGVRAVSVGALLSPATVHAVAAGLGTFSAAPVVCDPVIAASGGDRLVDEPTLAALHAELFPRCTLLTPNLAEAGALLGRRVDSPAAMRAALPALLALGPRAVLLKGGHLTGEACDVFGDGAQTIELRAPRLPGELRGTGSLLAAAVAARCAFGDELLDAILFARGFVRERIERGVEFAGMRVAF
jgi:hydroxymethylpyrimidine/phosphomethylpyrimidine kinase